MFAFARRSKSTAGFSRLVHPSAAWGNRAKRESSHQPAESKLSVRHKEGLVWPGCVIALTSDSEMLDAAMRYLYAIIILVGTTMLVLASLLALEWVLG
jgi:hypothetical protein